MAKKDWSKEFYTFYNKNPAIWASYCKYAKQAHDAAVANGRQPKFSTKLLNERIRWEDMLSAGPGTYKTTNSLTAYYARLLMWKYPQYRGSFALKRVDVDGTCDLNDISTWNRFYWSRF